MCTFAVRMKNTVAMEYYESIPKWIEAEAIRGHFVFTKSELCSAFPNLSLNARKRAISRLISKKNIVSLQTGADRYV